MHIKRSHHRRRSDDVCCKTHVHQSIGQNRHLQRCRRPKVVQQSNARTPADMWSQTLKHHLNRFGSPCEINLLNSRLTVNTQTQFGFPAWYSVLLGRSRDSAGIKAFAHRRDLSNNTPRRICDFFQRRPAFSQSASDLMNKERSRHTSWLW